MKKSMCFILAAILISGATMFTSCSDNIENPKPDQPEGGESVILWLLLDEFYDGR